MKDLHTNVKVPKKKQSNSLILNYVGQCVKNMRKKKQNEYNLKLRRNGGKRPNIPIPSKAPQRKSQIESNVSLLAVLLASQAVSQIKVNCKQSKYRKVYRFKKQIQNLQHSTSLRQIKDREAKIKTIQEIRK